MVSINLYCFQCCKLVKRQTVHGVVYFKFVFYYFVLFLSKRAIMPTAYTVCVCVCVCVCVRVCIGVCVRVLFTSLHKMKEGRKEMSYLTMDILFTVI